MSVLTSWWRALSSSWTPAVDEREPEPEPEPGTFTEAFGFGDTPEPAPSRSYGQDSSLRHPSGIRSQD